MSVPTIWSLTTIFSAHGGAPLARLSSSTRACRVPGPSRLLTAVAGMAPDLRAYYTSLAGRLHERLPPEPGALRKSARPQDDRRHRARRAGRVRADRRGARRAGRGRPRGALSPGRQSLSDPPRVSLEVQGLADGHRRRRLHDLARA